MRTLALHTRLPAPVLEILERLTGSSFEGFVVGGSVRDILLGREPKDWDITTNATPEEIQGLFPESVYENRFGTVGVKVARFLSATPEARETDIIEVTTYRTESGYADHRRPSEVAFVSTLEEDLARRDFTINALAFGKRKGEWTLVDPFGGRDDLSGKRVRAVGDPAGRFQEDALRLIRAVRFVAELRSPQAEDPDWSIEEKTAEALRENASLLERISKERIRDEFSKIILSPSAAFGVQSLEDFGLLIHILPELREGIGVTQNLHHVYTVWEHNLRALDTCPSQKLDVRLAALLHDVGKPRTKRGEGYRSTFYNHDHVGARMTREMLRRLKYPEAIVKKAALLVDNHLFYYNVGEVTEASVRRLIKRVGLENMDDLIAVRVGDRLGSGVPKGKPYKLRHLEYMIEKVSRDPISVGMLAISGQDLIKEVGLAPGPKIGAILDILLAEVIEEKEKNTRDYLLKRAAALSREELDALRTQAKERVEEEEESAKRAIRKKHHVSE